MMSPNGFTLPKRFCESASDPVVLSSQVILEGVADKRSTGHIAMDNIQIIDGLAADQCMGAYWHRQLI